MHKPELALIRMETNFSISAEYKTKVELGDEYGMKDDQKSVKNGMNKFPS